MVKRKNENTFVINGEELHVEITEHTEEITPDGSLPSNIYPVADPGCSWTYVQDWWVDVTIDKTFGTITIGALAAILTLSLNPAAAAAISIAASLVYSQFYDASTAEIHRFQYVGHIDYPPPIYYQTYFKIVDYSYALWQGQRHYLGFEVTFYQVL